MIGQLPVFVGTTALMLVVPGPDFVLVTRNTLVGDRSRGFLTAAGICTGLGLLTVLTAGGVSALVAASTTTLVVLRMAGGAYLLLLGALLLRSAFRRRRRTSSAEEDSSAERRTGSPMMQGFLNNVVNPKALVFYLTFMPQFLVPGTPVYVQTLLMGLIVMLCAAIWWTAYVAAVGVLGPALRRSAVRTALDAGAGTALAVLGVLFMFGRI